MAISIKEPCNEDWKQMNPNERGAHCKHCALDVIDFTNKTPIEIRGILSDEFSSGKRVCGRITNYQLDQINDDFFKWKSEQEAFRAVWIFSLIAVFGLTLFSCQHAPTREMIDQMNIEANVALEVDTVQLDLKDSTEISKNNDSISCFTGDPWYPQIVTYVGVMPYDWKVVDLTKWITCEVVLGDFILTGSVTAAPDGDLEKFLKASPLLDPVQKPLVSPNKPKPNPQNERSDVRSQVIESGGDKKFEAFIFPNPIEITSRLFLNVLEAVPIDISLNRAGESEYFRHGQSEFDLGKHQIDLKLNKLEPGEYQLKLFAAGQLSVLDFKVLENLNS